MNSKDIPEPYKTKFEDCKQGLGKEVLDIIDVAVETCPDWESAKDCIQNCLELLIEDAKILQHIINKE
jgi:hypothetical protein